MLDGKEIDLEIARLEYTESSYANYSKLADLYTIRDHMTGSPQSSGSEFLQRAAGKDSEEIWAIMDELMEALKVTNPRVYSSVMRRINELD